MKYNIIFNILTVSFYLSIVLYYVIFRINQKLSIFFRCRL